MKYFLFGDNENPTKEEREEIKAVWSPILELQGNPMMGCEAYGTLQAIADEAAQLAGDYMVVTPEETKWFFNNHLARIFYDETGRVGTRYKRTEDGGWKLIQ